MLKAFRRFLNELSPGAAAPADPAESERLAAAALLVHIANADGSVSEEERAKLRELLADRFGLEAAATDALIGRADAADREAVDLYGFTSVLTARLDEDGRARVIEMMWELVFADGTVHEFEDNLIWRVAELLGVSTRDRVLMKQQARARVDQARH